MHTLARRSNIIDNTLVIDYELVLIYIYIYIYILSYELVHRVWYESLILARLDR